MQRSGAARLTETLGTDASWAVSQIDAPPDKVPGMLVTASEVSLVQVQGCINATEATRTIWDGEPRTATSTFTQL